MWPSGVLLSSLDAIGIETQNSRAGSTHPQHDASPPPVQTSPIDCDFFLTVRCTCSNTALQETFSNQSASERS